MYKNILVAVDGSDNSNLALKEAINLAKEDQAALRVIHEADETSAYMMLRTPYQVTELQKATRDAGQKILPACAATARDAGI
jgi:nucleotide-binding universal stress UspA family protein